MHSGHKPDRDSRKRAEGIAVTQTKLYVTTGNPSDLPSFHNPPHKDTATRSTEASSNTLDGLIRAQADSPCRAETAEMFTGLNDTLAATALINPQCCGEM